MTPGFTRSGWLAALGAPVLVVAGLLARGERLDFAVTDALYHPVRPHFPLAGQWLLEQLLHRLVTQR